ncbi:retrovirus-related pol polyprotein from transposon TNT 1-94 [Tanacetum coccineum]
MMYWGNIPNDWKDIVEEMADLPCNNNIRSVLRGIILATTLYQIWKERNVRIFTSEKMNAENVLQRIIEGIRLQLQSLKVKKSIHTVKVAQEWNFDESNQATQRNSRTEPTPARANVQCYNCNGKGHYARDCPKPRVRDAKYFREQMLIAMKDEAESNLNDEENDFMLNKAYGDETLEELTAAVIMMARLQPTEDKKTSQRMMHKLLVSIIFGGPYEENDSYNASHELEKCQDRIKTLDSKTVNSVNSQEICDELEREIKLAKKAFKERENRYLDDIVDLQEKLSDHDRIVYKMGRPIQTIHMLGKTPNKFYDPFLKAGLGYKNSERLKQAIEAQPKMYDDERLQSTKLTIDSPDSEGTLEDAEESRLKMRHKMIPLDYTKTRNRNWLLIRCK